MAQSSGEAPATVFVNPGATYGSGRSRWALVEQEVRRRLGRVEVEEAAPPAELSRRVGRLVGEGVRRFVAAGGDGTVNALANALVPLSEDADVALGAVGLGSSNDFHKPFRRENTVEGMPLRVDFEGSSPCDVIGIDYGESEGRDKTRYSLVNASIGVTAEANAVFNEPPLLVRCARAISVDAAITASVLVTLLTYRDITCALSTDGREQEMASVTNLGVFKNPHFGGSLCYDTPVAADDGRLGIGLCEGLTMFETVSTLNALRRCEFSGRPKTRAWSARELTVDGDRIFTLETDGEIVRARSARFSVLPRRLRCAR